MKINFINFKNIFLKNKIKKIYNSAIKKTNFGGFSVNLKISDKEEIKKLNSEFRKVDKATDVLSFPNLNFVKGEISAKSLNEEIDIETGFVSLGDIVICKEIAKIQAKEYGHSYKREICFLALHGLLHLLGYDHLNEADEKEMMGLANKILEENKIKR